MGVSVGVGVMDGMGVMDGAGVGVLVGKTVFAGRGVFVTIGVSDGSAVFASVLVAVFAATRTEVGWDAELSTVGSCRLQDAKVIDTTVIAERIVKRITARGGMGLFLKKFTWFNNYLKDGLDPANNQVDSELFINYLDCRSRTSLN